MKDPILPRPVSDPTLSPSRSAVRSSMKPNIAAVSITPLASPDVPEV